MDWSWPDLLLLLALISLIVVFYLWALQRRRSAIRYSSLKLVKDAMPRSSRVRRHLPFVLFLLALASLVLALGRPRVPMHVGSAQTTIMLALDVSKSMCLTDIQPNRLEAAKTAARSLIHYQVSGTQVGVVAFARFAELVLPPTKDKDAL
jgi:Ca-activated chloride channel family protein